MNKEEYLNTQTQVLLAASIVRNMDLAGFLEAIEQAEAVGPILDPTLYRAGAPAMEKVRRLARGLREFQKVAQEVEAKPHET